MVLAAVSAYSSRLMKAPVQKRYGSIALQLLLLAVFVLPALVPTGYMIQRNVETSLVEVTICSGVNHRKAWLDVDSGRYLPDGEVPDLDSVQHETVLEMVEAELCPLAVSAAAIADTIQTPFLEAISSTEPMAALPEPVSNLNLHLPLVRGPPTLS